MTFPIELQRLAVESVAQRLGIVRPVTECTRCRCALYPDDLRCDALPCEDGCPAKTQLEAMYP